MINKLKNRLICYLNLDESLLRRITKNFSIGFVGSVLLMLISLGRTALLTKALTIDDYGRILVVLNLFTVLSTFLSVRVNDFIYRFYPQFLENDDISALRGVLLLSLGLSGIVGLVIAGGVFATAPWIAQRLYQDNVYRSLFQVYAVSAFFSSFDGFHTAVLRLHDRFASVVIPQVLGAFFTLILLLIYLINPSTYRLDFVLAFMVVGTITTTTPSFLLALRSVWSYLFPQQPTEPAIHALSRHQRKLLSNLFQTNLTGYLKLGGDTGGMFLLGIVASPTQVALYGIAQQLVKVLRVIQNNIQTAVTPEIVTLWAERKIHKLYWLVSKYTKLSLVIGAAIMLVTILLVRPFIVIFTTPEYIEALPTFYVLIGTVYLTFVSLVYFPLALSFDKLMRRNLIVSIRYIYLTLAVFIGLNAFSLALVQFFGSITVRIFNDMPLLRELRSLSQLSKVEQQTEG
jgi:O-antigen/teichoic acid export membrane protein